MNDFEDDTGNVGLGNAWTCDNTGWGDHTTYTDDDCAVSTNGWTYAGREPSEETKLLKEFIEHKFKKEFEDFVKWKKIKERLEEDNDG